MARSELILLALEPSADLDLMERALKAAGYQVAAAQDRSGLKSVLEESKPALLMIGEHFSGEDGIALAGELLDWFPTLPILLYAVKDRAETARSVLTAGLSGYLAPPLHTADIVEAVKRSLARARRLGDWLRREVKRTTASLAEKAKISEADRARMEAIFSSIQDGVIVLDEKNQILLMNESARQVFEVGKAALAGKLLTEIVSNPDLQALLERASASPLKYHEINFEDGRIFNAQYTPLPNIGAAITMQDISYLKEIDKLKNDFIYTVSHDLRTPLTAILGYTELLGRTGSLNENQQEYLKRIQSNVQHITTLINELLDMGRLEAGLDARRESVQLENILGYTLDIYEQQIKSKRLTLESELGERLPAIRANPIRIRQMLDNLLGNAIKYTPQNGLIRVGIQLEDRQLILRVQDSGPGIPPGEQLRIFEKFYRASNALPGSAGSGLGLAIVKSIVESHQGRVWVESELGKGSTFIVVLPAMDAGN